MIKASERFLSGRGSTPLSNHTRLDAWEAEGGALQPEVKAGEPAITMERLLDELGTVAEATEQNLGAAAGRLMAMREEAIERTAAARAAD